jgi:hypothetical protein
MTRSAAVTVRRPGTSSAPATSTSTWRQAAAVKQGANGRSHAASTSGTLAGIMLTSACGRSEAGQPSAAEVDRRGGAMAGSDAMRERIAAHPWPRGGVEVIRANRGYTLYSRRTGGQVARLRPTGKGDDVQVLWWRRDTWGAPGPFGPVIMPLDQALDFVATEGFFWINA